MSTTSKRLPYFGNCENCDYRASARTIGALAILLLQHARKVHGAKTDPENVTVIEENGTSHVLTHD